MKVQIINEKAYKSFPITDESMAVEVTAGQLKQIGKTHKFDTVNKCVIAMDQSEISLIESKKTQALRSAEISKLKKQLAETDYLALKFAEGLIPETEYAAAKAMRQDLRNQINLLQAQG